MNQTDINNPTYTFKNGIIIETNDVNGNIITNKLDIINNSIELNGETYVANDENFYLIQKLINPNNFKDDTTNNQISDLLLNNEYYCKTYLSKKTSINDYLHNLPELVKSFFIFSHLICPFEEIDNELYNRKNKSTEIFNKYCEYNVSVLYYIKKIFRSLLLIPGIIISPVILILFIFELKKMNKYSYFIIIN